MTRERPRTAEPKGKAKTLRQKDRIRTGLRKVHAKEDAHQRGNRYKTGNLSGSGASSIRRFHFFRGRIVSGKAAPAGNTLCISKGDNAAWRNCSRQRRNGFMEETPKTEAERPKGSFCLSFCAKQRYSEGKTLPPLSAFGHFPQRGKQERSFPYLLKTQISKLKTLTNGGRT